MDLINMTVKKISEKEAQRLVKKYRPSYMGKTAEGYRIYPLTSKKALFLKATKAGKFKDAKVKTLPYTKPSWAKRTI